MTGPTIEAGQVFGRLTVIESAPEYAAPSGRRFRRWRCSCQCGTEAISREDRLRRDEVRSCGCLHRDAFGKARFSGERVTYYGMHQRLSRTFGVASGHRCFDCGHRAAGWSYIRGCPDERLPIDPYCRKRGVRSPYCPHPHHFQPRCRKCHAAMDRGDLASARRLRAVMLTRAM